MAVMGMAEKKPAVEIWATLNWLSWTVLKLRTRDLPRS